VFVKQFRITPSILPGNRQGYEGNNSFSYLPDESRVMYRSKAGNNEKSFDALEWLAVRCSHVPNKGEQMVRYYGYYSNLSRGKREKQDQDE
jgi:hypothetical protein